MPLNGYWLFSAKPTLFIVFVSSLILLYTTDWTEIVAVSFLLEKLEIDLLPEACQVFGLQPFSGLFSLKRLQVPVNLLKRSTTSKIYPQYIIEDGEICQPRSTKLYKIVNNDLTWEVLHVGTSNNLLSDCPQEYFQ